jgi:hypothetical protein
MILDLHWSDLIREPKGCNWSQLIVAPSNCAKRPRWLTCMHHEEVIHERWTQWQYTEEDGERSGSSRRKNVNAVAVHGVIKWTQWRFTETRMWTQWRFTEWEGERSGDSRKREGERSGGSRKTPIDSQPFPLTFIRGCLSLWTKEDTDGQN